MNSKAIMGSFTIGNIGVTEGLLAPGDQTLALSIAETLLQNNYETVINDYGTLLTVEKLPFSTREINMRLIVRTNDPYSGALNHKNIEFLVAGTSGPFRLTSQQDSSLWEVGSEQTITWDVANTNDPDSVNCQLVNFYLSLD